MKAHGPGSRVAVPLLAALIAGTAWTQDVDPRRLLPAEYAKLTVQEINRQGLTVHGKKDYKSSADLFYYVTLLAPNEAYGHFNLACALSLLGHRDAAAQELRRALEMNRAWTEPNLKDPDLDAIRPSASFADLLAWLAGTGTTPAATPAPAPIPEQYRSQTPQAITKLALAAHNAGDYMNSSKLFGYVVQMGPNGATPRFNLACAFSRLGRIAQAIAELGRSVELDQAIVKYFDDPDLDNVRHEPQYGALMARISGRSQDALGKWIGWDTYGDVAKPAGVPAWISTRELVGPSASLALLDGGVVRFKVAAGYLIEARAERRGSTLLWQGSLSYGGNGPGDVPSPVSGIVEVGLVSPDILEVRRAAGFGVVEGYYRAAQGNESQQLRPAAAAAEPDMVPVPGGTFLMGNTSGDFSHDEEGKPVHRVTVSRFSLGKYEVTQKQWVEAMGSNPSTHKGDDLPVDHVNWLDAVAFCNALSVKAGFRPCYTIIGASVTCDFTSDGYRLPTEAEWEYAAKGGTASRGYRYAGGNEQNAAGWNMWNSGDTTHPVGTKAANELGFFDMSGNVWEWCWDYYGEYGWAAQTDPRGPTSGELRDLRGGSALDVFGHDAPGLTSSSRVATDPGLRWDGIGLRVARNGR